MALKLDSSKLFYRYLQNVIPIKRLTVKADIYVYLIKMNIRIYTKVKILEFTPFA